MQQAQQEEDPPPQQLPPRPPAEPLPPPLWLAASAFLLAATVLGFLAGQALPPRPRTFFQPMVVAALAANAGCAALGVLPGFRGGGGGGLAEGYWRLLGLYLTKVQYSLV